MATRPDTNPPCPNCGSDRTAWIFYGLPVSIKAMQADLNAGRVVLGGCCVSEDDPQWQCLCCRYRWGRTEIGDELRRFLEMAEMQRKGLWRRLREWFGGK